MICKSALFTTILLALCWVSRATYSDCGSVDGSILSVAVSNCAPNARRCILRRNTNATMTISFKTTVVSNNLTAVVHGVIMGVDLPFNLPNPDGCKDSGITCPIQADSSYKYITSLPIIGSYPRVTVDIKWELQDAEGKDVICALIPAKIS